VGAYHTGDVPYWLETLDSLNLFRTTRNWTPYDRELARRMSDAVVAFASTGDPSRPDLAWPRYEPRTERIAEFGDSVKIVAWPNRERLEFFASAPAAPSRPPPPASGPRPVY
jgi:para-nitrobenzyl esterase